MHQKYFKYYVTKTAPKSFSYMHAHPLFIYFYFILFSKELNGLLLLKTKLGQNVLWEKGHFASTTVDLGGVA